MSDFKKAINRIKRVVGLTINFNTDFQLKTARKAARLVRERTREGFGVIAKQKIRFNPLKKSTVKRRVTLAKQGKLDKFTNPSKSNLSASGKMLRAVVGKVEKNEPVVIIKGKKNNEKAERNQRVPFMDLTKEQEIELAKSMQRQLNKILKKI